MEIPHLIELIHIVDAIRIVRCAAAGAAKLRRQAESHAAKQQRDNQFSYTPSHCSNR